MLDVEKNGKKKGRTKKSLTAVTIDYPKNGDKIEPRHYAVRIGATGGWPVEISIDGAGWEDCRESAGYFWFDWKDISLGEHAVVARIKAANGKFKKSKAVQCKAVVKKPN